MPRTLQMVGVIVCVCLLLVVLLVVICLHLRKKKRLKQRVTQKHATSAITPKQNDLEQGALIRKKVVLLKIIRDTKLLIAQTDDPKEIKRLNGIVASTMERIKSLSQQWKPNSEAKTTESGSGGGGGGGLGGLNRKSSGRFVPKNGLVKRPKGAASFIVRKGQVNEDQFRANIHQHQIERYVFFLSLLLLSWLSSFNLLVLFLCSCDLLLCRHDRLVQRLRDTHRTKSTRHLKAPPHKNKRNSPVGVGASKLLQQRQHVVHHAVHHSAHPLTGGGTTSNAPPPTLSFQSLLQRGRTIRAPAPLFTAENDDDLDLDGDGIVDEEEKRVGVIARRAQASDAAFINKLNAKRRGSISRLQMRLEKRNKKRAVDGGSGTRMILPAPPTGRAVGGSGSGTRILPALPTGPTPASKIFEFD